MRTRMFTGGRLLLLLLLAAGCNNPTKYSDGGTSGSPSCTMTLSGAVTASITGCTVTLHGGNGLELSNDASSTGGPSITASLTVGGTLGPGTYAWASSASQDFAVNTPQGTWVASESQSFGFSQFVLTAVSGDSSGTHGSATATLPSTQGSTGSVSFQASF